MSTPESHPGARLTVAGVIVRGHGVASGANPDSPYPAGTIPMQLPHLAARGLALSGIHPATVNVDITPHRYAIRRPVHTFRDVHWTDLHGPETFSFLRCRLTKVASTRGSTSNGSTGLGPSGGSSLPPGSGDSGDVVHADGWVYFPHPETKPMHEQPASVLEVLMPYLSGLAYGDAVVLGLDPDEIEIE